MGTGAESSWVQGAATSASLWGLVPDAGPENPQGKCFYLRKRGTAIQPGLYQEWNPKTCSVPGSGELVGPEMLVLFKGIFLGRFNFISTEICAVILKRIQLKAVPTHQGSGETASSRGAPTVGRRRLPEAPEHQPLPFSAVSRYLQLRAEPTAGTSCLASESPSDRQAVPLASPPTPPPLPSDLPLPPGYLPGFSGRGA